MYDYTILSSLDGAECDCTILSPLDGAACDISLRSRYYLFSPVHSGVVFENVYRQKEMCCLYRQIHVPIMVSMVFCGLYCFSEDFQARSGYGESSKDHVFYSVIPPPLSDWLSAIMCAMKL